MAIRDLFKKAPPAAPKETRDSGISFDEYLSLFTFDGSSYPLGLTTMKPLDGESVGGNFDAWARETLHRNGVVFGTLLIRMAIFAEARFTWRQRTNGRPGALFGDQSLRVFEEPWPGGTQDQMLRRAIQDVDVSGNYFGAIRPPRGGAHPTIRRLHPPHVDIVMATPEVVDDPSDALDVDVLGYRYYPNGRHNRQNFINLMAGEVIHWAPIPDPLAEWKGMSWLSPIVNEVIADNAATKHKDRFWRNGATMNLMVKLDISDPEKFKEWTEIFEANHVGPGNAYKTLFLGAGADPTIIGTNMKDADFKGITAAGENRIAMAGGVPPTILGTSEGMQGSTLNAGNYNSSRRRFADGTMRPLWRSAAGAFAKAVPAPNAGAELWYDDTDISFLQEDQADTADILAKKAAAIRQLVDGGYTPESAVAAIEANDLNLLKHSGNLSVQLQPGGLASTDGDDNDSIVE